MSSYWDTVSGVTMFLWTGWYTSKYLEAILECLDLEQRTQGKWVQKGGGPNAVQLAPLSEGTFLFVKWRYSEDTISKTGSWPSVDTEPSSTSMVDLCAFRTENGCQMVVTLAVCCGSLSSSSVCLLVSFALVWNSWRLLVSDSLPSSSSTFARLWGRKGPFLCSSPWFQGVCYCSLTFCIQFAEKRTWHTTAIQTSTDWAGGGVGRVTGPRN